MFYDMIHPVFLFGAFLMFLSTLSVSALERHFAFCKDWYHASRSYTHVQT